MVRCYYEHGEIGLFLILRKTGRHLPCPPRDIPPVNRFYCRHFCFGYSGEHLVEIPRENQGADLISLGIKKDITHNVVDFRSTLRR